jgi:hypothetical protein
MRKEVEKKRQKRNKDKGRNNDKKEGKTKTGEINKRKNKHQ